MYAYILRIRTRAQMKNRAKLQQFFDITKLFARKMQKKMFLCYLYVKM